MKLFLRRCLLLFSSMSMALSFMLSAKEPANDSLSALQQHQWRHGSTDCAENAEPPIEVFKYDASSYILRQNKCLSYEAPFIYVLFGTQKVLVLDTGATAEANHFPLYATVQSLIEQRQGVKSTSKLELIVMHSHSHGDHTAADQQFAGHDNVEIVDTKLDSIKQVFNLNNWPQGRATIDLGHRILTIIPIPGHQEESLAVYDANTQWLLSGDTLYPGLVYVKHWQAYRDSIKRLDEFVNNNKVSAVLGAHIEMKKDAGQFYEIGTDYQPNEAPLVLQASDVKTLHQVLDATADPDTHDFDRFKIIPMNFLQRTLSDFARWILN